MREKMLKILADTVISRPIKILVITMIITAVMLFFAANLNLELSWVGLAPAGDPSHDEYNKILENYSSAGSIYITVKDVNNEPEEAARIAAKRLKKLNNYVDSINYKINIDYLLDNGLILYDTEDTEDMSALLSDPNLSSYISNLNNLYEKEYRSDSGNIKEEKKELLSSLRGLSYFLQITESMFTDNIEDKEFNKGMERLLLGDPYFRSRDGNTILMTLRPSFGMMDFNNLQPGVDAIEKELAAIEEDYPGYKFGITGMHVVGRDEMVSSTKDSTYAFIVGIILVLIILISAFKMWLSPLLAAVPLLIGIIWDMGLTALFIGRLNLLTAFTAAMLIGLGIDFSVHILSGYTEARSDGLSAEESVHFTLEKVGPGIITGALTTAAAFFTLTVSSLGFLIELGFVMGMGILTTVIAVFLLLPALLYLRSVNSSNEKTVNKGSYHFIGNIAARARKWRYAVIAVIILLIVFCGIRAAGIDLYLNIEKIEPKGLESIKVMNEISEKFDMSNDAVMYTTDNLNDTYTLAEDIKDEPLVDTVRTITDFIPPEKIQQKRLENLTKINKMITNPVPYKTPDKDKLLAELKQLNSNIIEMGQLSFMSGIDEIVEVTDKISGLPGETGILTKVINKLESNSYKEENFINFNRKFYQVFRDKSQLMKIEKTVELSDLPESIKKQYISNDGSSFLTSVHARGNLWKNIKKPLGKRFVYSMREKVPAVTGTPIFLRVLYDQTSKEVKKVIMIVGITLFILLLLHFHSIKQAFIAFIPLIAALIVTLGLLELLNINMDFLSVLTFPLIIGIGIDDGVHVIHRLNIMDEDIKTVFSSVGRAIMLTSLTTMASFGSLMIAKYQGIFRMGVILFIGVGLCFVMTVILIPVFINSKSISREKNSK